MGVAMAVTMSCQSFTCAGRAAQEQPIIALSGRIDGFLIDDDFDV
jgi:hypothetical protein